jgi:hypothetical protein
MHRIVSGLASSRVPLWARLLLFYFKVIDKGTALVLLLKVKPKSDLRRPVPRKALNYRATV